MLDVGTLTLAVASGLPRVHFPELRPALLKAPSVPQHWEHKLMGFSLAFLGEKEEADTGEAAGLQLR